MTDSDSDIPAGTLRKHKIQEVSEGETSKSYSEIDIPESSGSNTSQDVRFTAGLDPSKGELAELELTRVFQKDDFLKVIICYEKYCNPTVVSLSDENYWAIQPWIYYCKTERRRFHH